MYAGPEADRPPAGVAGRYWHSTDTGSLYRDDGSSWVTPTLSFNVGSASNTTPVDAERLRVHEHPVVDVTAYGAAGDGSTPDTGAIADAISVAESLSRPLYLPDPDDVYLVDGYLQSDAPIIGDFSFKPIIKADPDSSAADYQHGRRTQDTGVIVGKNVDNWSCKGIGVDCSDLTDVAGIVNYGGTFPTISQNYVRDCDNSPIQLYGQNSTSDDPVFRGAMTFNHVESVRWGAVVDGNIYGAAVVGNVGSSVTGRGLSIDGNEAESTQEMVGVMAVGNVMHNPGVGMLVRSGSGDMSVGLASNHVWNCTNWLKLDGSPSGAAVSNIAYSLGGAPVDGSGASDTSGFSFSGNYNASGERLCPTFSKGQVTVTSGSTTATFTHGMPGGFAPSKVDVHITPEDDLGGATNFWVGGVSGSSADVVVDSDPGQDVTFNVKIDMTASANP
jgi:hypothetical protein